MGHLVEVKKVHKFYHRGESVLNQKSRLFTAVDDVSLSIRAGESLGLIGESGSGKSTLGRMFAGLEPPDRGEVYYGEKPLCAGSLRKMRPIRKHIQVIFQNSKGVFDPTYTIEESLMEILKNNEKITNRDAQIRIEKMADRVGLSRSQIHRKGNMLSGGQRQRANIARALILHPKFVVCDEPVSSLDFSLRKQILCLLNQLREEYGLTYLFITHDLQSVKYVCDRVAIMKQGKIVEQMHQVEDIGKHCTHPYTKMLFAAMPIAHPRFRTK